MRHAGGRAVLLVEGGADGTGRRLAQTARSMGFYPVVVTTRRGAGACAGLPGAPEVVVLPRVDADALLALARARFGDDGVAGIACGAERFAAAAAQAAAHLGLPGPVAARVRTARDRAWQRETLAAGGMPATPFRTALSACEAVAAARGFGFPAVVRPAAGGGTAGARVCASPGQVRAHAAWLLTSGMGGGRRVLVEPLEAGEAFGVEVFSGKVVGIARTHRSGAPGFAEAGHDYPARLAPQVERLLANAALRATELLGLGWGPLRWEVRLRGGQAVAVEATPGLAVGFIPELVRHAQGIDLVRETLRLVVGRAPGLAVLASGHASVRFLFPPGPGRLAAVSGLSTALGERGVTGVSVYPRVGDALTAHGDDRDRIGHVIACMEGGGEAAHAAERARDAVRITVEGRGEGYGGRPEARAPAWAGVGVA
ncbi:MAG TPA: hypothetical protein VFJ16_09085 [Longimicrobium sp.]|nr:hypothetical protein [Longimicrobium sp.]